MSTELSDKADIIRKKKLIPGSASKLRRDFKAIRKLRDDIAHASYYAETPEAAREACAVVRKILQIKEDLFSGIEDQ